MQHWKILWRTSKRCGGQYVWYFVTLLNIDKHFLQESEEADEKTEEANTEESLVEKRERIGKVLRASSLQPPGSGGKSFQNYREYIRAAHHSMPEPPAAAMH